MRLTYRCLLAAATLCLAACATTAPPASTPAAPSVPATSGPAVIADRTLLDEKAMAGVELAYKAMRLAIETAADAGALKGERAGRVAELDRRAYGTVLAVRAAYEAANAESYGAAVDQALAAIERASAAIGGA